MKKISIILPFYNAENSIQATLNSLQNQTYPNFEVLCIDDGSTDNSAAILESYLHDKRFKLYRQANQGVSAARNYGLSLAQGEWITFIDSDDTLEATALQTMIQPFEDETIDIVICGHYFHRKHLQIPIFHFKRCYDAQTACKQLLKDFTIKNYCWGKLFKASLFQKERFILHENYEDVRLMHRLFMKTNKIQILPNVIYHYHVHPGSLSYDVNLKNTYDLHDALMQQYEEIIERFPECRNAGRFRRNINASAIQLAKFKILLSLK